MQQYVVRRLLAIIPLMIGVSVVIFFVMRVLPGDVAAAIASRGSPDTAPTEAEIEAVRLALDLDRNIFLQYVEWVWDALRFDLGDSYFTGNSVREDIIRKLPVTIELGLLSILIAWVIAVPVGIVSAVRPHTFIDYFFTFLSYMGVGTPNFLLALVIMWFVFSTFGVKITGLFSQEYQDAAWSVGRFVDMLKHIWVPMLILGTDGTARFVRIVRANLLDELSKPYVETARAKGLPEWKVVMKYPVRIALNPFISTAGWQLPQLFSGSLIVATVLSLPTVGPLLLRALWGQDMFLAGSIIMILSALTMIGTLISDIILAAMDPRIRMGA